MGLAKWKVFFILAAVFFLGALVWFMRHYPTPAAFCLIVAIIELIMGIVSLKKPKGDI